MIDDDVVGDWEVQSDHDSLEHQDGDSNLQPSDGDTSDDGLQLELPLSRGSADEPPPQPVYLPSTGLPVAPTSATFADNEYLASIQEGSGLHLATEARIKQAFDKDGSYGLFALFVTGALRQSIRGWTSTRLEAGGKKPLTESELNAYLGLEIAMSICPLNDIADYWSVHCSFMRRGQ
ncbi:Transposase IS4 [Phytophthora infestans]|uniref:Transposase IS4 n=1 Tax=Phytophthora infestans TaxID=4787 RepID=A0A8S9U3G7_PHYIN|nr:Transposase IS4 [Phytophthora infestans]